MSHMSPQNKPIHAAQPIQNPGSLKTQYTAQTPKANAAPRLIQRSMLLPFQPEIAIHPQGPEHYPAQDPHQDTFHGASEGINLCRDGRGFKRKSGEGRQFREVS